MRAVSEAREGSEFGWKNCHGGICAPHGFTAGAVSAGLKKEGLDLVVLLSDRISSAAACFTGNRCAAAPVKLCREHLRQNKGWARAVLVNSGCANAATGFRGMQDARATVQALAGQLQVPASSVLVCSTGVIGLPLEVDKIFGALPRCLQRLGRNRGRDAARAIATTDTILKIESICLQVKDGTIRIGGIAKGAGMIHPDMATMLAFVTTDAAISPGRLQRELHWCVDRSFNCITVDGDTSTNDTVIALANGASGVAADEQGAIMREGVGTRRGEGEPVVRTGMTVPMPLFRAGLLEVCQRLARKIAWDGEGATHHLEIQVSGARDFEQARGVARAIGRSNLVKTAIYGHDPNWGRVLSAAGASGEDVSGSRMRLAVDGRVVAEQGVLKRIPDAVFLPIWKKKKIRFSLDLSLGDSSATCWSCDLSHKYIDINASYRT